MRLPKHAWPNDGDASRGILIFAQLMAELLSPASYESYRAYTLCTISRLREALIVIDDVRDGRINQAALNPIISELTWSLARDPIVSVECKLELASFSRLTGSNHYSLDELKAHIALLLKLNNDAYKAKLESLLISLFSLPDARNDFRKATAFYCSHLINRGFAKTFIARVVEEHFYDAPVVSADADALRVFFRRFRETEAKHNIYAAVADEFGRFLAPLGFDVRATATIDQTIAKLINPQETFPSVAIAEREALDSYSAMASLDQTFSNIRAFTYLAPTVWQWEWNAAMYVAREGAETGVVETMVDISFQRDRSAPRSGKQLKDIRRYLIRILNDFDERSTERLTASINTAALARTSSSLENKMIPLWSAVEVLLSEPPVNMARIVHYSKQLIPAVCLRYARLLFAAVSDEMLVTYRKNFAHQIYRESTFGSTVDMPSRFASAMLMPEHERIRAELLNVCSANPLALHRLYRLNREFSSPSSALASILAHEKRVEWQIHRIYRARNNLVHAGRVPSYLDALVVNLFEYYRSAVATIVNKAKNEDQSSDIDQIVAEIGIEYGILKNSLKERGRAKELSVEDLKRLVRPGLN